jgi:hypothetical protein
MFFCFIILVVLNCALHMVSSCVFLISMASRCVFPIVLVVSSRGLHLISMVELCSLTHLSGLEICFSSVFYDFEILSPNRLHGLKMCSSPSFDAFELCSLSHFNGLELAYLIILVILICVFLIDLVVFKMIFSPYVNGFKFCFSFGLGSFELRSFGHFNDLDGLKICSFNYF